MTTVCLSPTARPSKELCLISLITSSNLLIANSAPQRQPFSRLSKDKFSQALLTRQVLQTSVILVTLHGASSSIFLVRGPKPRQLPQYNRQDLTPARWRGIIIPLDLSDMLLLTQPCMLQPSLPPGHTADACWAYCPRGLPGPDFFYFLICFRRPLLLKP